MKNRSLTRSDVLPAVLANVGHGSHICAFYETKDDLIDLVRSFFASGVNDLCVWAIPDLLSPEEAAAHASEAAPSGMVETYPARKFYLKQRRFDRGSVARFWDEKVERALSAGRSGMHGSGDAFWIQPNEWNDFLEYETELNDSVAGKPMSILCTYPLSLTKTGDLFDVACAHHVAIARRNKEWVAIKSWGTKYDSHARDLARGDPLDAASRIMSLSQRERQALDAIAEGHNNKVIARDLGITVRTVEAHRARLLARLGVSTMAEAVRLATQANEIFRSQTSGS